MIPTKKIRILVVDDSVFFRKVLIDNLSKYPQFEIIGSAIDPMDAMSKIPTLKPDVITLDVEMPKMTGIEFLKYLLPRHSIPVVLVSSLNISVFDALSAGAIDFVRKPDMQEQSKVDSFIKELAGKISIASKSKVRITPTIKPAIIPTTPLPTLPPKPDSSLLSKITSLKQSPKLDNIIIALGASTGGTEATLEVLKNLPANTPGMVIVQHMPAGFTKMYAERLNRLCPMEVKEAVTGDKIVRGRVLLAPGELQMRVVRIGSEYSVKCQPGEKVSGHCPSVDLLFNSVAETAGANSVGIIMTGMGKDGAEGLLNMRKKGAYTIGQDEASCVVYGMPMVAYNIGAVTIQTSCGNIAGTLKNYLNRL